MNSASIETKLLALIDQCRELGLSLGELDELRDLTKAGEPGIALENLCTQLFEYDAVVPAEVLETFTILGRAMGLDEKHWRRLEAAGC